MRKLSGRLGGAAGTFWWVLVLTAVFIVGVAAAVVVTQVLQPIVTVAVGSEDVAFFSDPAVQAEFQAKGLDVEATPMGSGQAVNAAKSGNFDAVLPSSGVYYRLIEAALGEGHYLTPYPVFHTPLVVFTRKKYVRILREAGIVNQQGDFDVAAYLEKLGAGTVKWGQFPGLAANDPIARNQIVLLTTDPHDSDSGAVFAAYAGYLFNGDRPVSSSAEVTAVAPKISAEFTAEGDAPTSTQYAYDQFVSGSWPLDLGYQSEAKDLSPQPGEGFPANATVLPLAGGSVDCVHTLLALNNHGLADKLGNLLRTDPVILGRERAHGFNLPASGNALSIPSGQRLGELINAVAPHS